MRDDRLETWENRWYTQAPGEYRFFSQVPWSSYEYRIGTWMAADVDGDGRDELLHNTGLRLNTWDERWNREPGTYRVYAFWPWELYPYADGVFGTADVDGNGAAEIIHVTGERLNTWENRWNREPGTYRVYSFWPWPSYDYLTGFWAG